MKTKHTKGNWSYTVDTNKVKENPDSGLKPFHHLFGENNKNICSHITGDTIEEAEANAKLIAAAPEMLKELNELIKIATLIHKNRPDKYNVIDYATLAKAILKTEQLIKKATN